MARPAGPGPLGEFLHARRSRLHPSDAGVPTWNERRRVSGLRRDELAGLAGVSTPYYARLEQGSARNASPEVLEALARALGLDELETRHLHDLARAPLPAVGRPDGPLSPRSADALRAVGELPALVLNRAMDVLAWNDAGHAFAWSHVDPAAAASPDTRPNSALATFLDPRVRTRYVDWPRKARAVAAYLRRELGRHPGDARLREVITRLDTDSDEFAQLWHSHAVGSCPGEDYEVDHPDRGRLAVRQLTLAPVGADGQLLIGFMLTG